MSHMDKMIADMNARHPVSASGVMKPRNTSAPMKMPRASKPEPKAKQADPIHIKAKNKGKLHAKLGVAKGKKIPQAKIVKAEHSSSPAERKEAVFAENASHWHHAGPSETHVHIHMNDAGY